MKVLYDFQCSGAVEALEWKILENLRKLSVTPKIYGLTYLPSQAGLWKILYFGIKFINF